MGLQTNRVIYRDNQGNILTRPPLYQPRNLSCTCGGVTHNCAGSSWCDCDDCCDLDSGPGGLTEEGCGRTLAPLRFSGTQWQQDTPVGTQWQRSGVFNNFNGDEPAPKKGSVAQYIMGLLGVGILFYTIGFALKKGQLEGK